MGLERKIAWAALGGTTLGAFMWGLAQQSFHWPPIVVYAAILLGGVGSVLSAVLWFHIAWVWLRRKGLQLGPAIVIVAGAVLLIGGGIWGAVTWSPNLFSSSEPPTISYQKYALFWVETEPKIYHLGIVAKLFNADNKTQFLNGLTFEMAQLKFVPRGGYLIQRYTEFPDRVDFIEDNYIRPNDAGYYKKLLPVRWEMKVLGGVMPDLILTGRWSALVGSQKTPISPRAFGLCNDVLTVEQWNDLLKPKSQIDIANLSYFEVPADLSKWNDATVVGVSCIPKAAPALGPVTPEPGREARSHHHANTMGNVQNNSGIITQGQTGDNTQR